MDDERLSSINPYYPRENGGCVYRYFQDMVIGNRPILDTLRDLYRNSSMTAYMDRAYDYIAVNEAAIRQHIEKSQGC